jgi:outer membrane lipoprotein LolB
MLRVAAVGLLLALTGCAAVAPRSVAPPAPMVMVPAWSLQGRISVKTGEESLSGQLQWQHQRDVDILMLASPLGQGVAKIVRDANGVVLEIPGEPARQAPTVEALTEDAMGYALPVAGLVYWVQANADPASRHDITRDDQGRPARISQDGWTIEYLQYFSDNPSQPRKMKLLREDLEIRLVTDTWQPE